MSKLHHFLTASDHPHHFRETKRAIRAYQLERLRYFYAVCKCDSDDTAICIYEACDGVEYETSGVRFDLRFIPEEMVFDVSLFP